MSGTGFPTPFRSDEHYYDLRLKLVVFFERRGCPSPEDMADDCLHRVKVSAISQGLPDNTDAFAFGVAKNVYREWIRQAARFGPVSVEDLPVPAHGSEARLIAKLAIDSLDPVDRHLLEEFYLNQGAEKLAAEYGLSPAGLRTKIHRVRKRLMQIYTSRKNPPANETKPVPTDTDKAGRHGS